jgi:hypothetical protein
LGETAVGRGHLGGDRAIDLVAHLEALGDRTIEVLAVVHLLDQPGLAIVDARLADAAEADVRDRLDAAEDDRRLVGEGDRLDPGQLPRQPAHEPRAVVARPLQRLAQLDGVLGLEMAARHVVGPGEGDEGQLPRLPQGIEAVLQRRVQAPVAVQRQGRVGVRRIGPRDAQRRPGLVIEIAAGGDHHIGRVIGPAQEHHQQPRPGLGRGPGVAGDQGRGGGGESQEVAANHGGHLCMNSGDDR